MFYRHLPGLLLKPKLHNSRPSPLWNLRLHQINMRQITIQKGLPMPETRGRRASYPFGEMEVGDSFATTRRTVRACSWQHSKRTGKKFICRKDGNRIRVWRTK
jgi:hypothetical protein